MKTTFQKDTAFLDDVRNALPSGKCKLWWLGQSGFLIVHKGRAIILDPYLSDSLTRKYAATDKPHVRMTERVVDPAALGELGVIDVITSSHNHTDHLDAETLEPLLRLNPEAKLAIPAANRDFVIERLGTAVASRLVDLDDGTSTTVSGVEFHGIAAAHPTIERDQLNRCKFLGYVLRLDGFTIYHSGDTLIHERLVPSLWPFAIDVALLPINGDRPERRVAGNLDGAQAARLAHDIGARLVIPCHFDLFEFNTASPDEFSAECQQIRQPYRVLGNGEGLELSASLGNAEKLKR
jgi:L-ascorbate metabolism protein UlaG (beta-lactamase superfamily)